MAQWKKIVVSGSNAILNEITASSGLKFKLAQNATSGGLKANASVTPLVIDTEGNVHTGSAYALASGGNTVGGSNLTSNVVIVGNNNSLIQTASSTTNSDFNSASIKNIANLTASNVSLQTLDVRTSNNSSSQFISVVGSDSDKLQISLGNTNLSHSIKIVPGVTMSNVPDNNNSLTDVLVIGSNGEIKQRPSSELGGVTSVDGGTNLTNTGGTNSGGVTLNLDDNISISRITASNSIHFSSSGAGPKNYVIDYAKVFSSSINSEGATITHDNLLLDQGNLTITASGIKVEGDLEASGSVTLDGNLSFTGFNFTQENIGVTTGSSFFGSGSTGSMVQATNHQFTGSVFITGSSLTLTDGILTIPNNAGDGTINVAQVLSTTGLSANLVTIATFNSFSSSFSQSVVDFLATSTSLANEVNTFESFSSSFSQSVVGFNTNLGIFNNFSQSFSQSVVDFITTSESLATAIINFESYSSSISTSIDTLTTFSESIAKTLTTSDNDITFKDKVTIKGDLTVLGNTTTLTTQDLIVEDRYIFIGSSSANSEDVGIVFSSGSNLDKGRGIVYDANAQRFITAKQVDPDKDDAVEITSNQHTGHLVTVKTSQLSPPSPSSSSFGEGELYIDNNNDIYIYVD